MARTRSGDGGDCVRLRHEREVEDGYPDRAGPPIGERKERRGTGGRAGPTCLLGRRRGSRPRGQAGHVGKPAELGYGGSGPVEGKEWADAKPAGRKGKGREEEIVFLILF